MVWAIVPARLGPNAKGRLAAVLGERDRSRLARAMLVDVLTALAEAPSLDGIAVVSRDAAVLRIARTAGAIAIREAAAGSLNAAVAEGIAAVATQHRAQAVLIAMGDLPLLAADDVEGALRSLPPRGRSRTTNRWCACWCATALASCR